MAIASASYKAPSSITASISSGSVTVKTYFFSEVRDEPSLPSFSDDTTSVMEAIDEISSSVSEKLSWDCCIILIKSMLEVFAGIIATEPFRIKFVAAFIVRLLLKLSSIVGKLSVGTSSEVISADISAIPVFR